MPAFAFHTAPEVEVGGGFESDPSGEIVVDPFADVLEIYDADGGVVPSTAHGL